MSTLQGVPDVIVGLPGGYMVERLSWRAGWRRRRGGGARPDGSTSRKLEERYGSERARQLAGTIPPLIYIFPNLIYIMMHLRYVQPVSVDETFVYYQPVMLQGVPDQINEARLREHEFKFGAGGAHLRRTTSRSWPRNQHGVQADGNDWSFVGAACTASQRAAQRRNGWHDDG